MDTQCESCSQLIPAEGGRLPPWCPRCGADLKSSSTASPRIEAEPLQDPNLPRYEPEFRRNDPKPLADNAKNRMLLFLAIVCGCLFSFYAFNLNMGPTEPRAIERERYTVQSAWEEDEERQQAGGADLVVRQQLKGGDWASFTIHVIRPKDGPPALADLAAPVKEEWPKQLAACKFLEEKPTTLAGQPALRIVAVGRFDGRTRRREGVLMVHGGIGYRLTCEGPERQLDAQSGLRQEFQAMLDSFTLRDPP